jgi:hypothetical protein
MLVDEDYIILQVYWLTKTCEICVVLHYVHTTLQVFSVLTVFNITGVCSIIYIYIYIHIHTYIHTYIYIYIYIYMYIYVYIYL